MIMHNGLAVYRFGNGEPVFLMPGPHRFERPGLRMMDALIDGLVAAGRQVITYDPPGSGQSTRPAHLSMAEMLDCTDEALTVCGVTGPVDAAGHSMGGLAALAYAVERRNVRRLVLIGSGAGGPAYLDSRGSIANRSHPGFWGMAALGILHMLVPTLGPQNRLLNFIDYHSFVDKRLHLPDPVTFADWLRPRVGRTDWQWIARKLDYTPRLGEISVPALLLCGRHDPQFPPAATESLAAGIPDAQTVWFERSGHYPFLEEPAAFWHAVRGFLHTDGW